MFLLDFCSRMRNNSLNVMEHLDCFLRAAVWMMTLFTILMMRTVVVIIKKIVVVMIRLKSEYYNVVVT